MKRETRKRTRVNKNKQEKIEQAGEEETEIMEDV